MGWISRDGIDVAATGAMELSRQDNLAIAAAMLSSLMRETDAATAATLTAGSDNVAYIFDLAHQALRTVDAEVVILDLDKGVVNRPALDRVSDAIAAIEKFARDHKITLSEFA